MGTTGRWWSSAYSLDVETGEGQRHRHSNWFRLGGYYKLFLAKYGRVHLVNSWTFQSLAVVVASFVTFFFNLHNITDRVMANLILIVVLTQIQSTVNSVGFDLDIPRGGSLLESIKAFLVPLSGNSIDNVSHNGRHLVHFSFTAVSVDYSLSHIY